MKLVRLVDAGQSGTALGKFLEALMREFELPKLLENLSRSEMQSNYQRCGLWNEEVKLDLQNQLLKIAEVCIDSDFPAGEAAFELRRRLDEPHIIESLGYASIINADLPPEHIYVLQSPARCTVIQ